MAENKSNRDARDRNAAAGQDAVAYLAERCNITTEKAEQLIRENGIHRARFQKAARRLDSCQKGRRFDPTLAGIPASWRQEQGRSAKTQKMIRLRSSWPSSALITSAVRS
jgi:hypothetical protein